jgi:hypothetical protein
MLAGGMYLLFGAVAALLTGEGQKGTAAAGVVFMGMWLSPFPKFVLGLSDKSVE